MSEEKVQVASFSGGRISAYMCYLLKKKFGEKIIFIFMDTGAEHPKTYEFIRWVNKVFGLNLICLRAVVHHGERKGSTYEVIDINDICADLKPFKEIMVKYGTPSIKFPHCTREMKTNVFKSYCKENFPSGYITWLGIRADEPKRLKNNPNVRYLADISDYEKSDILNFWKEQPYNLEICEALGNCVFCVKKGINKIAYATRLEPNMLKDFKGIIEADDVRPHLQGGDVRQMYRGRHTLDSIIKMYEDFSDDDIANTIRSMKLDDSECSESCEVNLEFEF